MRLIFFDQYFLTPQTIAIGADKFTNMEIVTGNTEYFKSIGQVKFEGLESDNPLAFRWYDENRLIAGKTMKEYLRFACAYWHSFCGNGADPFGAPTHIFPWNVKADAVERAKDKADAAFEFITKLGMPLKLLHWIS